MRDAHRLLRDATRVAHDRLDALFTGFDLTSRDGYARFIGAQADAMLAVEAAIDRGADGVIDDWPLRRRSALLEADRALLDLPRPTPSPFDLEGAAEVAAALYVVEGSRHGARHLRRMVPAELPSSFLGADQAPGNWPKLLAALDRVLYDQRARDLAQAAAVRVFDRFAEVGRRWQTKENAWQTAQAGTMTGSKST